MTLNDLEFFLQKLIYSIFVFFVFIISYFLCFVFLELFLDEPAIALHHEI